MKAILLEVGGQRSEVRGRRSEVGGQRSEARGQRPGTGVDVAEIAAEESGEIAGTAISILRGHDLLAIQLGTSAAAFITMPTSTYRDLDVWKQGMDLVQETYSATESFPKSEMYGLTGQLRRATVSIPANIAEGHSRRTTKSYLNQLSVAIGSQAELETLIELSRRLRFLSADDSVRLAAAASSVGRLLYGLHRALARKVPDL